MALAAASSTGAGSTNPGGSCRVATDAPMTRHEQRRNQPRGSACHRVVSSLGAIIALAGYRVSAAWGYDSGSCTGAAVTSCRSRARPTRPIACCGRWRSRRSIIAAPSSPSSAARCSTALKRVFQTAGAGRDLSGVGQRRLGGGARQHAVARRSRAGVRHRRVREELGRGGAPARASTSRSCPATGGTASIRTRVEARLARRSRASHSRRARRPQRDVDRRRPAGCPRFAARSIAPVIRRCCSSMRSRRSARSISATTSGGSTSRWRDRRRG